MQAFYFLHFNMIFALYKATLDHKILIFVITRTTSIFDLRDWRFFHDLLVNMS